MSDLTPSPLPTVHHDPGEVTIVRDHPRPYAHAPIGGADRSAVSRVERDAILASLYEERSRLTRLRRLGATSPNDEEYLAELDQYIDEWQGEDVAVLSDASVWAKLEGLASSVLAVQADLARLKK